MQATDSGPVLLISAPPQQQAGGLFAYEKGSVRRIDAIPSTGLAVAQGLVYRAVRISEQGGTELFVYDRAGLVRYARYDMVDDPHDVLVQDGRVFIVSSSRNAIFECFPDGRAVALWQADAPHDAWHVNCLTVRENRIVCAAFGRFDATRGWAADWAGAGIVFDVASGRDVLSGLSKPHTPRWLNDSWVIGNSGTQELLRVLPDGTVAARVAIAGFIRGTAVVGDTIVVTASSMRNDGPEGEGESALVFVDIPNWTVLHRVPVPCGELYDVIVADDALLHGVRVGADVGADRVRTTRQYELFRAAGSEPARLWAVADPLPRAAFATVLTIDTPATAARSSVIEITCSIANRGMAILVSALPNPVHVGYRWFREGAVVDDQGLRTPLPRSLPPGETALLALRVRTPNEAGAYVLHASAVQELVAWFDDVDPRNGARANITIE